MRIPFDRCPLCDAEDAEEVRVASCEGHPLYDRELPKEMRWIRCDGCAHVFVDGYLDDASLAVLFRKTHPFQLPGPDTVGGRGVSAKIVERVSSARGAGEGRWLDVGFGNGALLATAAEFGYDVTGLDMREESVRRMRELGFDAHTTDLAAFDARGGFDVISMADVLEHLPFPRQALAAAHARLRDGGALFVSMPNMDSLAWRELDREGRNPYWGELEHLHNFGRARLYALLRECGFEPCRYAISERYLASMEVVARKL
jgi:SAM-dependent methyltransferase